MTIRYLGLGGSDSNNGLSWANRKLTLNGVEDTPVVAGDIVYVGPGVYRELLTVDVAGSNGSPITYIGDVTGENTDGVGGVIRITGSDNDLTATRGNCIYLPNFRSYRTFRGLLLDTSTSHLFSLAPSSSNVIMEDCIFLQGGSVTSASIYISGGGIGHIIRRCIFQGYQYGIFFTNTSAVDNTGILIENCLFNTIQNMSIRVERYGNFTINNCTLSGGSNAVRILQALTVGQTVTINNCIISGYGSALVGTVTGEIIENYNALFGNGTDRTNVGTGANSVTCAPIFVSPILLGGHRFPWNIGDLSRWSQVARKAGTSMSTDDLFGMARPTTDSKKSWGAIQAVGSIRETTTIDGASGASIKFPDAGEQFIMRIPVTNVSITIGLKVYRETDYTGTNPSMIIRQPGQSDRVTTDTGNASQWNSLSDTFTPAANPGYIDIFFRSSNTATSGNYDAFCDTLTVS